VVAELAFDEACFERNGRWRTTISDYVDIVIQSYRHRSVGRRRSGNMPTCQRPVAELTAISVPAFRWTAGAERGRSPRTDGHDPRTQIQAPQAIMFDPRMVRPKAAARKKPNVRGGGDGGCEG